MTDAHAQEALNTPPAWLWTNAVANVGPLNSPSPGRFAVSNPNYDLDEAGAVTLPGIIDSRIPYGTQLVVPGTFYDHAEFQPHHWIYSNTVVIPPPPGVTVPVATWITTWRSDEVPSVWLNSFNGHPLSVPTRISAGGQLVVEPKYYEDVKPFIRFWQTSPAPGTRPSANNGFIVLHFGQEQYIPDPFVTTERAYIPPPSNAVIIPNYVGMYFYDAQLAILQAGYYIDPPVQVATSQAAVLGIVNAQSPAAGTVFPAGTPPAQIRIQIYVNAYLTSLPPLIS